MYQTPAPPYPLSNAAFNTTNNTRIPATTAAAGAGVAAPANNNNNNNNNNSNYKRPNPTEVTRAPNKRARPAEFVLNEESRQYAPELYDAYIKAQKFDKELEYFILKKRVDLIDVAKSLPKVRQTLRIYLSNVFVSNNSDDPNANMSWILKIQGHLLDNPQLDALIPFTTFFHKIAVHLDPAVYNTNNVIEWDRPKDQNNVDARGIELVRIGNMESRVKVILEIEHGAHSNYKIAEALAAVLRIDSGTKAFIVGKFWEYVKHHKLQDPLDKKQIILNDALKEIFEVDTMLISSLGTCITPFLVLSDEFRLDYFLSKNFRDHRHEYVYDVQVPIPAHFALAINSFITSTSEPPRVIQELDMQIAEASYRLNEHMRKLEFMNQMADNPVMVLRKLIESQNNDVAVLKKTSGRDVERERKAKYYEENPDVVEGVVRYLDNIDKLSMVPSYHTATQHLAAPGVDYVTKQ